ncbi:reverse transcriptase-like protein [Pontibacillus litoralis]|uniref:RNase H type-1 domain-containing protein n=1 Tax=Pontibacillus litoralis JSM 072002 TaxID=1385512 RepID=A0A0A5HTU6_9BACI|nr:reverse transcriptase-like protein [Pontibacillus litoralis]KGX87017.1 hypothetical protein N784_02530 [Pontibacillus litoralis JSM 072002]
MNMTLEWIYQLPKGLETAFTSEPLEYREAILVGEDLERTGRVKQIIYRDSFDTTWTLKDLKRYVKEMETEPHHIKVHFDGGFDLETQEAGLGCAIYYEQNGKSYRMRKNARVEELHSNNEAEYAALHLALVEVERLGVRQMPVTVIGDSQVVIHQLSGEWPCLDAELSTWADRIEQKLEELKLTPSFRVISRKNNREADRLATQALEHVEVESIREV